MVKFGSGRPAGDLAVPVLLWWLWLAKKKELLECGGTFLCSHGSLVKAARVRQSMGAGLYFGP